MASLDTLLALAPPASAPMRTDWRAVERRLGVSLPGDYRAMVEAYGPGCFDDFLCILAPSSTNANLDLMRQSTTRLKALATLKERGEDIPFELGTSPPSIIPWAITDKGDVCYWISQPVGNPDGWSVTVNEARGPEWAAFDGSATEFIAAVLSRAVVIPIFPLDFPSSTPRFTAR